jgi:hypothetical protein
MVISGEITVGTLITVASVLISALALAYGWRNDRQLRRKEYADRIRRAASVITAKLDRWQSLVLRFFDDIQPLLLEVERAAAAGEDTTAARYALLRGLYEQRAVTAQRVAQEEIESAHVDLYGYDSRIHQLFSGAIDQLQEVNERAFDQMKDLVQREIAALPPAATTTHAVLQEDALRRESAEIADAYKRDSDPILNAFRNEVLKLIEADDDHILARDVPLTSRES